MLFFGDREESLNRIAHDQPAWSWVETLAAAEPGTPYRITDLVFALVRDRCHQLGLQEGDEIRCLQNRSWALELERPDGGRVSLERDYAWFIQVEPVERGDSVTGGASPTC